jgi:hypothetical protein
VGNDGDLSGTNKVQDVNFTGSPSVFKKNFLAAGRDSERMPILSLGSTFYCLLFWMPEIRSPTGCVLVCGRGGLIWDVTKFKESQAPL